MDLSGTRIAILTDDLYEDLELWYPVLRFQEAGAEVAIVGAESNHTYKSKHGYPVRTTASYKDADSSSFDGVMIPGGYAPDRIRCHPEALALVRSANNEGKLVAAICHGGWVLCSAHVVKGRRVTGFYSIKDDLVNAGGRYQDAEVVVDGNLVTSRHPGDLPAFCRSAMDVLAHAAAPV